MEQMNTTPRVFPLIIVSIFLFVLAVLIGEAIYIFLASADWASIRCLPHVMPFAGLYGHDVNENFRFCMSESFKEQAAESLAPLYKFFGGFIGVLSTLVDSTNSLRVGFATFMGGFVTLVSEFGDRFKAFMGQLRLSAQRIKMLMYRVYATFYAMMYMSLSSIRAVNNFGGTALFGFLDTFCFDPATMVHVEGRGAIPVVDVVCGDVLSGDGTAQPKARVTARFQFAADGQPMVWLPGDIYVSTNHYISHGGAWIRAEDHPDALAAGPHCGGAERPLICFNTDNNTIPIGAYVFRDYDETADGAPAALAWTDTVLNGRRAAGTSRHGAEWHEMLPAAEGTAKIVTSAGEKVTLAAVRPGMRLRPTNDIVVGVVDIEVAEYVDTPDGKITPATLVWISHEGCSGWRRLGDIVSATAIVKASKPLIFKSLVVLPGCRIEFASGLLARDYMEVASPLAEEPYSAALSQIVQKEIAVVG
jgi:hypothetical protein